MASTRKPIALAAAAVLSIALYAPQASSEAAEAPTPAEAPAEPTAPLRIVLMPSTHDVEGGPEQVPTSTTIPPTTTTTEAPTTTKAPIATTATGVGSGDPNDDASWERLMQCESGGLGWGVNTGNGYYGGLQFDLSSWRSAGGSGRPDQASREEQIKRGRVWYATNGGWRSWPACTHSFGWR